jgi:hypothetical protein
MKKIIVLILVILLSSCKPEVENLGFFAQNREKYIAGLDGFSNIETKSGRVIWTFGDTILGEWKNPPTADDTFENSAVMEKMIPNSIAVTESLNESSISDLKFNFYSLNKSPSEFIKENISTRNIRIWPLDGIELEGKIYIFYVKIKLTAEKNNPFKILSNSLAEIKIEFSDNKISKIASKTIKELNFPGIISMGDSVLKKDLYIYIAGRKLNQAGLPCVYFARAEYKNFINSDKYEYLSQDGNWSENFSNAGTFFSPVAGEFSISYNEYLKSYVVIYMGLDGILKSAVFSDFSKIGPDKNIYSPQKLPVIDKRPFMFYYSGKEIYHSEKFTYAVFINPAVYQPVLLKIPSALIRQDP